MPIKRLLKKVGEIDLDVLNRHVPYIAGFLDGEGTFTICWNKRARSPSFRPLISVSHTNEEVIQLLKKTLQVTYTPKMGKKGHRPYYLLRVTTKNEIITILEALKSSLIVKKEHAQIILDFMALKEKREFTRKEIAFKKAELYLRIRQLNPKGKPFDLEELRRALEERIEDYFKDG
jgi:hypothetical protein